MNDPIAVDVWFALTRSARPASVHQGLRAWSRSEWPMEERRMRVPTVPQRRRQRESFRKRRSNATTRPLAGLPRHVQSAQASADDRAATKLPTEAGKPVTEQDRSEAGRTEVRLFLKIWRDEV